MPSPRLLVLDDEPSIASVLARALTDAGYRVEPVTTAKAAREKLLVGFFQLAIVDCRVPGDDGMSIAEFARSRGVAVVLISGEDKAIAMLPKSGFNYLTKPFHLKQLLRAVETALMERAQR